MIKKRDLIIAVWVTFCLTAMLFMVRTTRSQIPGQYDPWLDITGDGKIQIDDVAWVSKAYGTTGDPTKNVNVTNWPSQASDFQVLHWQLNITAHSGPIGNSEKSLDGYCGGYAKLSIFMVEGTFSQGNYTFTLIFEGLFWQVNVNGVNGTTGMSYEPAYLNLVYDVNMSSLGTGTVSGEGMPSPFMTDIKGPNFRLWFSATSTQPESWGVFDIYAYLRND